MALTTFPLAIEDFFDGLPVEESVFDLSEATEFDETQGGNFYTVEYGEQMWRGSFQVRASTPDEADRLMVKAGMLRRAGASFFVSYKHRLCTLADPFGTLLGNAVPKISALAPNNLQLSLKGLPPGYQLAEGDRLSFAYGAPANFALHNVVSGGAAAGTGILGDIEVTPPIRPGAALNAPVILKRPFCEARIIPNSYQPMRSRSGRAYGFSAEWAQVLR